MIQFRRRNTTWLIALGVLIAFALTAFSIPVAIQVALMGIFMIAMIASMVELTPSKIGVLDAIQRAPINKRISPQAKEAAERVKGRGGYITPGLTMLDVGLIALQSGRDGIVMRRTRSISKDDDGTRPFITLYVDPDEAERFAVVRFEMFNQNGEQHYVHEMRTYLRDGEVNVLADHHLPLAGNQAISGSGDWDLRIYIDGNLVGMHNFMLAPSMEDRRQRLAGARGEAPQETAIRQQAQEEIPPTLEQLLSTQQPSRPAAAPQTSGRRPVRSGNRPRH